MIADCTVEGLLHAPELPQLLGSGARALMVSNEHPDILERLVPDSSLEAKVKLGTKMLKAASEMRITSSAGTDLTIDVERAPAGSSWGYTARPGTIAHWPGGLCLCFPAEGTVNGTLVMDVGDVNLTFKRYTDSPIRCTIENDFIVDIEGSGVDAGLMKSYLEAWGDREAYAVSHVGWGMNPAARWDSLAMYDKTQTNGTELRAFGGNLPLLDRRERGRRPSHPRALRPADAPLHRRARWPPQSSTLASCRATLPEPLPEYLVVGDGLQTLVFLHGLGGDHSNWQPQIADFASDYRCIAWTLPGYGASPALESLTWPNLSDTLARVLDDVGVDIATVIGLSMGGYIAQQFAADHEDRVDRLVLAATTSHFGPGSASFAERFLAARLEPLDKGQTPADLAPEVARNVLGQGSSAAAVANCIRSMSQISSDAYREALRCLVTWNFTQYLDEITAPTLCLAGADDKTAPVAAVAALADGIPDARLEIIDDCQHLMNLDKPAEFNRLVRDFLTSSEHDG